MIVHASANWRGAPTCNGGLGRVQRSVCSFVLVIILAGGLPCPAQNAGEYHARADQALQSFLLKFWNGGQQYLRNKYPSDGTLTSSWTYAHGWDALMDGVERTGGRQYYGLIESFYQGQNQRGWFSGYYDDECWMTLALTRAYDLTGEGKYLEQAQAVYADVMTAWDTTCCGSRSGGLWWDKAHTQKATAANGGAALAGARLFQRTGNAIYLNFAQQAYGFWFTNMVDSTTSQVCDHINSDGTKVWWRFTYNEGLMIGASLELYLATGNAIYLNYAHRFAGFMTGYEVLSTVFGRVLSDGDNSSCGGDCHEFKGPAFRYLSRLYAQDPTRPAEYATLKASADAIWNLARDTNSTVFAVNWLGPAQSTVDQLQDNAACMALNRFAQLIGPYPGSGIPFNQYEAENATIKGIQLEATYGSFTGWGYIAGWNTDGSSVDFHINCAAAGQHSLLFRYAAGAGDAWRVVKVNGNVVSAAQRFPATSDWATYSTGSVALQLPAGPSTVSLIFDASRKSANWLNLDNLTVTGDPPEEIRVTASLLSAAGTIHLAWNSRIGETYQVQFNSVPVGGTWTNLGGPVTATAANSMLDDSAPANSVRFYRVVTQP